jgi:hypothetical protein
MDDSGHAWLKLAHWFQRRRFLKKFTDRRRTPIIILKSCKESNAIKPYGKNAYVVFFQNFD